MPGHRVVRNGVFFERERERERERKRIGGFANI